MCLKGQSAVELTMVIGMALLISSPFIISSQSSIADMRSTSQFLGLDRSLEKLQESSQSLQESSFPARRLIKFQTPDSITNVYNPQFENRSAVVFEAEYRGTKTNHSVLFDYKVTIQEFNNLSAEGVHKVSLKKRIGPGVNVSVIS